MNARLFLVVAALCAATITHAQQILCERALSTTVPTPGDALFITSGLLQPQPDSIRLVSDYRFGTNFANLFQTKLQRLSTATCDTLPAGPSSYRSTRDYGFASVSCSNQRGEMLIAQEVSSGPRATDSLYIRLSLFGRNGRLRWQRRLPPTALSEGVSGLIAAPGGGYFACGGQSTNRSGSNLLLLRLDSLGRVQWRRTYFLLLADGPRDLAYSRRGTLLLPVNYYLNRTAPLPYFGLMEMNQRGDSLTTHRIVIDPLQQTKAPLYINGSLQPLRDGGFAVVGNVDSASTGYVRPFLARLDANLNVAWFYIHRPHSISPSLAYRFAHPYELADGSLTVLVSNTRSGRNEPFWLFCFAPTGALRNRYGFTPQVLPPFNQFNGYLGGLQGLQPLSDSTFIIASGLNGSNFNGSAYSHIYSAHLRVPGLPRVIDSHYLPAALGIRPRTALVPGALGPAHPNPASETVSFAYVLPGGAVPATLVLHDLTGRRVLAQPLAGRTGTTRLAVAGLPGGLYLATLEINGQAYGSSRKLAISP